MIKSKLILIAVSATLALATVQSSRAQTNTNQLGSLTNLYPASFHAICISTNTNGIVYKRFGNANLIQDCATQLGLSNVTNLRLVYNRAEDALQVIAPTN